MMGADAPRIRLRYSPHGKTLGVLCTDSHPHHSIQFTRAVPTFHTRCTGAQSIIADNVPSRLRHDSAHLGATEDRIVPAGYAACSALCKCKRKLARKCAPS